jgi:hypothetical protein
MLAYSWLHMQAIVNWNNVYVTLSVIYCIHRRPKVKRACGGWWRCLVNMEHLFGQVTLPFDHFLELWGEQ